MAQVPSCTGNAADEAYVIGAPNENIGATADAGSVAVVDVPSGGALNIQQDAAEAGDLFGLRVATAGHLLVAAAPEEDLGSRQERRQSCSRPSSGCYGTIPDGLVVLGLCSSWTAALVPGESGVR